MKVSEILRFKKDISVQLNNDEQKMARAAINKFYLNDENCNYLNGFGHFVSKYPEKETPEFCNANSSVPCVRVMEVEFILYSNGVISIAN